MRHLLIALCILAVVAGLSVSAALGADVDWPTFRGPNHDGKSPDTGLLKEWPAEGPKLLWKVDGLGGAYSSVSVCGGMVFASGDVGGKMVLSAFDLDGKSKWKAENGPAWGGGPQGARSSPTIDGGKVYLLGGSGTLGVFDAKTGAPVWSKQAKDFGGNPGGWGYAESVLIYKDWAIFKPGGKNCIVALDKATGEKVWASTGTNAGPEYGCCLPFTFDNVAMIVTGTNQGLVCVSADKGEVLWTNKWCAGNTANCPTPAYSDGYVFWSNGYGKGGICMKLAPGGKAEEAWTTKDLICHHGGYIIQDGYIYGNHNGGWSCLDLKTGQKKWTEKGVGKGSLCWADGMLYLFSENGGQAALATCSPEGMEIKGKVKVEGKDQSWAHPVVIGGRLYLRFGDNLYCFDVKAK